MEFALTAVCRAIVNRKWSVTEVVDGFLPALPFDLTKVVFCWQQSIFVAADYKHEMA